MPDDIFPRYPAAAFKVKGEKYYFPVVSIRESGGNRLIPRERPYRDGAKVDDTGSQPKSWTLSCLFNNTVGEAEGLTSKNKGFALYPSVLDLLIGLFDIHETGTLTVPTIGEQPVRADTYTRTEVNTLRSEARLDLTFLEDNQDGVDFRTISSPTADANAHRLAETTTFDTQSEGDWDQMLADCEALIGDMETLHNSPQNVAAELKQTKRRHEDVVQMVIRTHSRPGVAGQDSMVSSRGNSIERKLTVQRGAAARTANAARRGRPQVTTVQAQRRTSLFALASILEQDFMDLVEINPELDPMSIPAGTPVNVYASTGAIR